MGIQINGQTDIISATDGNLSILGITGLWLTATKSADESVISNATLQNDDHLKFTMAANTTYQFELTAFFDTVSTARLKFGFNGPASPTLLRITRQYIGPGDTVWQATGGAAGATLTAYDTTGTNAGGNGTGGLIKAWGVIQNGANAGDFNFTFAQQSSNVNAITVLKGSYLTYYSG
jgi:hypothetical protein